MSKKKIVNVDKIIEIRGIRVPYHHGVRFDQCDVKVIDNFINITEKKGPGDWKIEINLINNSLTFYQEATVTLEATVLSDSVSHREGKAIRYDFKYKEDHPFHPERAAFWLLLGFNVDTTIKSFSVMAK